MGAAWAPTCVCLHLGLWEEEDVFTSPMYADHVHTWLRYIDDVHQYGRISAHARIEQDTATTTLNRVVMY